MDDSHKSEDPEDCYVVGLYGKDSGRSCCAHRICGKSVRVGDLLRLRKTVVDIGMKTEDAIAVVKIVDGEERCRVGFVRADVKLDNPIDCFIQVKELYSESDDLLKTLTSKANAGLAQCAFLRDIPYNE